LEILGIIPTRYASSRFPGKALVDINGKSMVQRVYLQALKSKTLAKTLVATDDNRIFEHVKNFGGEVVMTSVEHKNGTERCLETLQKQTDKYDYVINIQGDEPFIDPRQIDLLASLLDGKTELATLAKKITTQEELNSNNVNKVIWNKNKEALYFSRTALPYLRNVNKDQWINQQSYYKHIGIYGYRIDILEEVSHLQPSSLELAESLEQLRWLENGYIIKIAETEIESTGIDTPEDLEIILSKEKL